MKCPSCSVAIHFEPETHVLDIDKDGGWVTDFMICPACSTLIVELTNGKPIYSDFGREQYFSEIDRNGAKVYLVKPRAHSRPPCPAEVPPSIAEDYTEACLVLSDSPKASAALSRRCLQHLLRQVAKVKAGDLANEIQQVLDQRVLPSALAEDVDAIRNIGNFAAHPMKSTNSGEILPVEPAEAEWNLEVLESLFDHYFVQPAIALKRREALDAKLIEAGKPPMKRPKPQSHS